MVLDTSALLALLDEPEAEDFRVAVEEDTTRPGVRGYPARDGPRHRGAEG
jgi:hypothetical protein